MWKSAKEERSIRQVQINSVKGDLSVHEFLKLPLIVEENNIIQCGTQCMKIK